MTPAFLVVVEEGVSPVRPAKDNLTASPVSSRNVLSQFEHLQGFEDGHGGVWGKAVGGVGVQRGRPPAQKPSLRSSLSERLEAAPHLPRPPPASCHLFLVPGFPGHFSFQRAGGS